MFKVWQGSAGNAETLARDLEAHLNEYADEVMSVSYAIAGNHFAIAVYRELDISAGHAVAISAAEQIIDDAHP
ncbi:MAG TPA: hypothetical protein VF898_04535 [Chloroflexota bacterium]